MTHKDIYIKFMIEYDKANVTSSYPSLTEYEVATVLDKAYNALIAQKVTGNNLRRAPLEADLKSITDLSPLITSYDSVTQLYGQQNRDYSDSDNSMFTYLQPDFLYFVSCDIKKEFNVSKAGDSHYSSAEYVGPIDQKDVWGPPVTYRRVPVKLVSHEIAENFKASSNNIPWIKNPVCCLERGNDNQLMLRIYFDPCDRPLTNFISVTYIKKPNKFVKDLEDSPNEHVSFFDCPDNEDSDIKKQYKFELNDTMAEELISLAVSFALENVESPRLNTKLNMRGLES